MARRPPIRFNIGAQRISSKLAATTAGAYTKDARAAMRAIEENYRKFTELMQEATAQGVEECMNETFDRSVYYCPVSDPRQTRRESGRLVASHYVDIKKTSRGVEAEVGVAKGNDPPYAIFVHEILSYQHDAPTQAKFLERAASETVPDYPLILDQYMGID